MYVVYWVHGVGVQFALVGKWWASGGQEVWVRDVCKIVNFELRHCRCSR